MLRTERQPDLLSWAEAAPVAEFEKRRVQAASFAARFSKAIAAALKDEKRSREQVAAAMGDFLGREVRVSGLNSAASEGRADHVMNVVLFMALVAVTRDRRLLQILADEIGCVVVERRWVRLIDLAKLQEAEAEIKKKASALRHLARTEGTL